MQLIEEILNGNQGSYRILYKKYQAPLFAICLRYGVDRPTAQDFFQEGQIKIFKNIASYDYKMGDFLPWAKRVMANSCINMIRSWKRQREMVNLEEANLATFESNIIQKLSFKEMLEVVQILPPGYRMVFNMFVMDGFSHAEIAEKLNITVGTSKSQLSKAKRMMAGYIKQMNIEIKKSRSYG